MATKHKEPSDGRGTRVAGMVGAAFGPGVRERVEKATGESGEAGGEPGRVAKLEAECQRLRVALAETEAALVRLAAGVNGALGR